MLSVRRALRQPAASAFGFEPEDAIKKLATGAMSTAVAAQIERSVTSYRVLSPVNRNRINSLRYRAQANTKTCRMLIW